MVEDLGNEDSKAHSGEEDDPAVSDAVGGALAADDVDVLDNATVCSELKHYEDSLDDKQHLDGSVGGDLTITIFC